MYKNNKKQKNKIQKNKSNNFLIELREKVISLYVIFLLGIFPFLMHDGFLDISKTKSDIFMVATAITAVVAFLITLFLREWKWILEKRNWLIYLMVVVIAITTWNGIYPQSSLTGEAGRWQGAYVCWAYCLMAFLVINFGKYKEWYLDVLLIAGAMVCFIAILNFYEIDVLGTLGRIKASQRHEYLATIGQMNTFAAYLSIITPVAIVKALTEKHTIKKYIRYAGLLLFFGGMNVSTCDSVYITLGVLFLALPFWCLYDYDRRKNMAEVLITFAISMLLHSVLNHSLKYPLNYVNGMAKHFLDTKICLLMLVGFVLLYVGFYVTKKKLEPVTESIWQKIWGVITIVSSVIVSAIYLSVTTFDKEWGNLRGGIWAQGWDFYSKQPFDRKLLGIGLDVVLPVFRNTYGEGARVKWGYYNNLHNEYLHYLVTIGLIGLVVYLIAIGVMLYRVMRNVKHHTGAFAIGMATLCYLVQAITNISMSSVTTIILLLLYLGQVIEKRK